MMKRLAILAGLLVCAGCFTAAPPEGLVPVQTVTPLRIAQPLPGITPDQVTEKNGHQVAQSLEEEINREQQQSMLSSNTR